MEIKKLNETKEKLVILIKDTDHEFINTLRRIILTDVPTLAIKSVSIKKNNSNLFDEIIAHRLGLIPLVTDLKTYELPEKCSCKGSGCAKCQLGFYIKTIGPKMVYAEDIVIQDPAIKPVQLKTPIVKLIDNQELELEGIITLGNGKEHSKYTPAHIYYKGLPKIKIENPKNIKIIEESCPTNVFQIEDKKLRVKNLYDCIICQKCAELSENKISVFASEKEFIFTIESWGQLKPKEILKEAKNC